MGIHDRDYIRQSGSRGGGMASPAASVRGWSVTTWLIAICVAVFVIDGFLPLRYVPAGYSVVQGMTAPDWSSIDFSPRLPDPMRDPRHEVQVPVVDGAGNTVGFGHFLKMRSLEGLLHFSTARVLELWRLVGFQFMHANLTHLLFNMIGLYFFGPLVERYLGRKRYLAFYLLCGMFGAIMYGVLNLAGFAAGSFQIPGLLFNDPYTPLIGASAGVFGVLMAGAYLAPNATVLVFFFLPMRLQTLAYALVAIALFTIITGGNNAGGEAGHLGGAIAGFYFIRHPHHLHGFFDILGRADPTSHHYHKRGFRPAPSRSEVDRILDKVNREGIHSLTPGEKRILQKATER